MINFRVASWVSTILSSVGSGGVWGEGELLVSGLTTLIPFPQRQIWALWKHAAKKYPGPSATSSPGQPPSESVYTVSPPPPEA